MENMMIRNQSKLPSSALSIHRDSQTISKAKPKIRIIHIFAPEIIKTDVANFRELVQRLTGKPSTEESFKSRARKSSDCRRSDEQQEARKSNFCVEKPIARKMELRSGFLAGLETARERFIKEEESLWIDHDGNYSGGFLSGFGDFDGFIQELGEFPLLPLDVTNSHHMHGFEEAQLA